MSDYTDNPIARAWKKRYQNFSPDIQYKLDALYNASSKEYQFNVIKKSRKHPSKGDVFIIKSKYVDEFGNEIFEKPDMVESFGVATITGIAYKVRKELIIHSDLVKK